MTITILTPEKTLLSEEAQEISLPTPQGEITILPGHIGLVTQIADGEVRVKTKNKTQFFAVTSGFAQMQENILTLLADYAVRSEDINTQKVLEAKKRAEEQLKKQKENLSERDFAAAQAEMRRAILELKVSSKRRNRTTLPGQ